MIYNMIFYILWNDYMKLIIISITSYTYSIVRHLRSPLLPIFKSINITIKYSHDTVQQIPRTYLELEIL